MDDYDDIDIAARLMCGEDDGIDKLVQQYGRRVAGVLKGKFPSVPNEDRLLAMFAAARKAVLKADTFDEKKGSLPAWFTQIAVNCVKDMLRDGRTAFVKSIDDQNFSVEDSKTARPFADEERNGQDLDPALLCALAEAIEELPEQLRRVVKADLATTTGQANTADLAKDMGLAVATIRQHRKRYKEKLAEIMKQKGHTTTRRRVSR